MSTKIHCDGFGCTAVMELDRVPLTIQRTDGYGGAGMPSGTAHLCGDCGRKAWSAVDPNRPRAAALVRGENTGGGGARG